MPRPKGSKNKVQRLPAEQFRYTLEERIDLVADLLVDKILEDQHNGKRLLSILELSHAPKQ